MKINKKIYLVAGAVIFLAGLGVIIFFIPKVPKTATKGCTKFSVDSYEIFKKEPLADSNNFVVLYYDKMEDKSSVLYGQSYKMAVIDSSDCILDYLYPRPEMEDWTLTGYQWLRTGDFNNDGKIEIAYLGYAMGTGHENEFVLFQQQDNGKFTPVFYWNNGENNVEIKDVDLDGKEEVIHYYRILGYRQGLYWRDVFKWNNSTQQYERQNDSVFYDDLVAGYLGFIKSYNNSEEYKYLVEAAKCLIKRIDLVGQDQKISLADNCLLFNNMESIINFPDGYSLISSAKISSIEQLNPSEIFCATPYEQEIKGEFNLYLFDKDYNVLNTIPLTNPTILFKKPLEKYEFEIKDEDVKKFYQPWDVDGDGKKEEFVVQEYGSCNGNMWKLLRYNETTKKIDEILFVNDKNQDLKEIFVSPGKNDLEIKDGFIRYNYYDNSSGKFFRNVYKFDKLENKFKWQETQTLE